MAGKKKNVSANKEETVSAAAENKTNEFSEKETDAKKKETKKTVYIEYGNGQINIEDICRDVMAASVSDCKAPDTVEIYIKPEERAAYYVVNGKPDGRKVELYF